MFDDAAVTTITADVGDGDMTKRRTTTRTPLSLEKSGPCRTKRRQKAEGRLGDDFDIREFHAQVLDTGSLPLPVLEAKIDRWIASKAS